jgi:hypothetical protein
MNMLGISQEDKSRQGPKKIKKGLKSRKSKEKKEKRPKKRPKKAVKKEKKPWKAMDELPFSASPSMAWVRLQKRFTK